MANYFVAEFQPVVVSCNQPIVPRKYKHGCLSNNHVCIFLEQHVDCEEKPVATQQEDDLPKKYGDYEFGWSDQLEDELLEVLYCC